MSKIEITVKTEDGKEFSGFLDEKIIVPTEPEPDPIPEPVLNYYSIFPELFPISNPDADSSKVNLGIRFRPKFNGNITAIKFYKSNLDKAPHTVALWDFSNQIIPTTPIVQVVSKVENASGWITVPLPNAIPVTTDKTYVASFLSNGRYFGTSNFSFEGNKAFDLSGDNGLYSYGDNLKFPIASYNKTNYWVDVVLESYEETQTTTPVSNTTPIPLPIIDWPNEKNTGATGVLKPYEGNMVISTDGAVVENLDIKGMISIRGRGVILRNCRIVSPNFYIVDCRAPDIIVEHCTIDGVGFGNEGSIAINGSGSFLYNNIFNVENAFGVGSNTIIKHNYIHDLKASGSPHYDGIQMDGGQSNVWIEHNTIINDHDQTSAIMIDNWAGAIDNVVVTDNLLVGGGYTIYVDGQFNNYPITNVSITNNHMGTGGFGITNFNKTNPIYTGNVNDGWDLIRFTP